MPPFDASVAGIRGRYYTGSTKVFGESLGDAIAASCLLLDIIAETLVAIAKIRVILQIIMQPIATLHQELV
ncbi:MAG: hypothetical protein RM347_017010 [Nostoc sp. ChiQUE02]|uniref:hypothetical protein n=1 Tax=Nostoc sp. ChiQUE02 TaxID=3075377 RepID=UPI002AD4A770|nr:hypothetical protein [Nostoc sp. ChiQUE02]MDZ8230493.1 hypothetical protein [Nostoc sp. ChiQUE02]